MTWVPMLCPYCGMRVRGDAKVCKGCGDELNFSAWAKEEQKVEDRAERGECECCGRPLAVCDADPCIQEG